jgi:hypothetical protein
VIDVILPDTALKSEAKFGRAELVGAGEVEPALDVELEPPPQAAAASAKSASPAAE